MIRIAPDNPTPKELVDDLVRMMATNQNKPLIVRLTLSRKSRSN